MTIYDRLSRTGKGVPLLDDLEWLSVDQLVPAWAEMFAARQKWLPILPISG